MTKKMKVIFTLSLIFNILFLGIVGGHAYRLKLRTQPWVDLKERLSPESRDLMKEALKSKKQEMKDILKEARQKRGVLIKVFAAEDFDPVAYNKAAEDLLLIGARISEQKIDAFRELGLRLSQEERESLSRAISANMLGRLGRKGAGRNISETKQKHP